MKINFLFIALILSLFLLLGCAGEGAKDSVTANGFKYTHHVQNDGVKPQQGDFAYFHVHVRNPTSGNESFNSREQAQMPRMAIPDLTPAEGKPAQPVVDALVKMSVGDSLTVLQPLADLPKKPGGFEDTENIAYDIVLMEIKSEEEYKVAIEAEKAEKEKLMAASKARSEEVAEKVKQTAADYTAGKLDGDIQTTASGLKYVIHEQGTGDLPQQGQTVVANYYGSLTNGERFDDSFSRGSPFKFQIGAGRVIRGWDEGFALFNPGTKATLFIPSDLGYGAAGSPPKIPGGSELIFYVELNDVL